MAKIDISSLSLKQLQNLIQEASERCVEIVEEERKTFMESMRIQAEKKGLNLDDMYIVKKKRKKTIVKPKYHDPENPSHTWSGRGRKPKWLVEVLANGKSLDDLLI